MLSSGLSSQQFSSVALIEFLLNILFGNHFSQLAASDASANLEDLPGKLKSSNGDGLPCDSLTIDKNSLIADDVENGYKFSFEGTEVDPGDSSDFDE